MAKTKKEPLNFHGLKDGGSRQTSLLATCGHFSHLGNCVIWDHINCEFSRMISPLRDMLNRDEISIQETATIFSVVLVTHLHNCTINKIQTRASSILKRWLNIPKCAILAFVFHPEVTNFSYLPHVHEKAKLRLLASVHVSKDLNLKKMQGQINDPAFEKR